ncbi:Hypothetical protein LUCI_2125 [Lucifera butyrica]|uniref:DUF2164 domain-containing protein n=1 Tax=Lucifera butyrica TaxID=1351585 RepID=A0A498R7C6_9FIRM|nr:DUF2164 domain-containing protein [Lucifera butyrica]VBB06885.1 Hypothetical protein LUCI_2125 [Lucifera butyrica]
MKKIELDNNSLPIVLEEIQKFYQTEREETISDFQASLFLDFILAKIGPYIYNQAITDAHQFMTDKTEELFTLQKRFR